MFFIGLLKKSLLADGMAPYASPFTAANRAEPIDFDRLGRSVCVLASYTLIFRIFRHGDGRRAVLASDFRSTSTRRTRHKTSLSSGGAGI